MEMSFARSTQTVVGPTHIFRYSVTFDLPTKVRMCTRVKKIHRKRGEKKKRKKEKKIDGITVIDFFAF